MSVTQGVSICVYGESGIGKTCDAGYVFRKALWLNTEPGGMHPVLRSVGYTPENIVELFDLDNPDKQLRDAIENTAVKKAQAGEISSVVLDTGSEIADRMLATFSKRTKDGRQAYLAIQMEFTQHIRRMVSLGIWFIMICHEVAPELDPKTGVKLRGGPLFPGKKLPRSIPPKFDMVLRADIDDTDLDGAQRVYRCNPLDNNWIMKDRFAVTKDVQPMELAPLVYRIKNPGKPVPQVLMQKKLNLFAD